MKRLLTAGLSLVLLSVLGTPGSAHAATPVASTASGNFNLTTSPLPVSLTATPGTTVSTPIKIENTGTGPVKINVSLEKFSAYGDQGKPQIQTPTASDTFIKWASFSENSFTAQPGVFNTVTMTIKVPKDAAFGYYYAVVFSEDNSNPAVGSRQTTVNGAVATLILLDAHVAGEKRSLQVTKFSVDKKFYEYLPASFTVSVHNNGNIHVVPTGNIFITKNHKDDIAVLDINSAQGNILPNSNRQFAVDWSDGFPHYQEKRVNNQVVSDKNGKPRRQLVWDFAKVSKLRVGHYYAQMDLVYNNGTADVPIEGEVGFWVVPWRMLLVFLLIVLLSLTGIFVLVRGIVRRIKKMRQKRIKKTRKIRKREASNSVAVYHSSGTSLIDGSGLCRNDTGARIGKRFSDFTSYTAVCIVAKTN